MNGGNAQIFDTSANSVFAPSVASDTNLVAGGTSAVIDRFDKELNHVNIAVNAKHVTAGNVTGDEISFTFELLHCDTAGGTYVTCEEVNVEVAVDAAGTASSVVSLPRGLNKYKRFIKFDVSCAMTAGSTGTLTSCVGGAVVNLFPEKGWPDTAYNKDGYSVT